MENFWKSKAISDRYEFIEELGKGGIGTVFLAHDRTLDKQVAIKILNANLSDEESIRFQQEGILSGKLKHENIVSVHDFGITDTSVPYLIMEYLHGVGLAKMISVEGTLDTLFAIQIFQQICRGMRSSHNQGVVHRDLKPANIFMVANDDDSFSAKIVDFGLARLADQDSRLTAAGSAIGSPLYMSPEQAQGLPGDERSDIYSMGCLMFEALTGSVPFQGETAVLTLMMHQSVVPDRLEARAQRPFPSKLEIIVARCLKKLPDERYQSFGDLLHDLEVLEGEIIRDDREAFFEARSRSGIQKALGSVTDFSTPIRTSLSTNENVIKGLIVLSAGAIVVCAGFLINPLLTRNVKDVVPEAPEVVQFGDTLDTFSTLKKVEVAGKTNIVGGPTTNDNDLRKLKQYPHMDSIELGGSQCEGTGFDPLLSGCEIVMLDMHGTEPTEEGLSTIASIRGLKTLNLKDCDELENKSIALLAKSKTLKDFSFGGEHLTDDSFKYLQNFPALQLVTVDEFHITGGGMKNLLKVPGLRTLNLIEPELERGVFQELQKFPRSLFNLEFTDMKFSESMVLQLAQVPTKNITLTKVETTPAAFARFKKDPRYLWTRLEVDEKKVPDR